MSKQEKKQEEGINFTYNFKPALITIIMFGLIFILKLILKY